MIDINTLLKAVWEFLKALNVTPPTPEPPVIPVVKSRRDYLLEAALAVIGKDASPKDLVKDDVACVESLGNVIRKVMPFPDVYGTAEAFKFFKASKDWKATLDLKPGNVIISVTGTGNGNVPHGHCGIIGKDQRIMSNTSATGLWQDNYSIDAWVKRFRIIGGMAVYVFEAR